MIARLPSALALALAAASIAFAPAPVMAQAAKPQALPSQAVMQHVADNFRILMSALQSDKVPPPVKSVLFTCVYGNPFGKISEGTDKVMTEKKLDKKNPTQVLTAMAAICGYRPEMAKPAAPAPKK